MIAYPHCGGCDSVGSRSNGNRGRKQNVQGSLCSLRRPHRELPAEICPRQHSQDHQIPRRADRTDTEQNRLQAGRAARLRVGRTRLAQVPRRCRPYAGGALEQGRQGLGARQGIARRRDRHLAAVLARLHDQGEVRQGVAEVTYCNSISVAEHIVMMILALVRNYIPSYGWVIKGGWNIADCVERSYDLEGMNVGTVAAGRIGLAALRRLKPFDVKLHYYDKHRLPKQVEKELDLTFHPNVESLVK